MTDKKVSRETIFGPKMETSIGTWNVKTLKTDKSLKILEKEPSRYNCDIVGVSETHKLGTEEFLLHDYKYVGQWRTDDIHRSGVGFLLGKEHMQHCLRTNRYLTDSSGSPYARTVTGIATILQVNAPTTADTDAEVDQFNSTLQRQLSKNKTQDIVTIMGDLNAKVGSDRMAGNAAVGPFGLGIANERGEQLMHFCSINGLVITNTFFKQWKASRLWTWESPDGVTHNQIDYIMVSKRWTSSIS